MKRGFIRGLWGIHEKTHRIIARRYRTDRDINRIKNNKFNEPFVTYVFGEDNYEGIKAMGFESKLVSKEPQAFDLVKYQFRNKLELIKYAMFEDGYDEVVFLDWDCVPQKKLPDNYWDEFQKKEAIQACLQLYHRRKCHWRPEDKRKVPNGGFVYIRDKELVKEAINLWEETGMNDSDEIAWAKLTDRMMGGWKGVEKYLEMFEAPFCNLHANSPFPKEVLTEKDVCFIHYQG